MQVTNAVNVSDLKTVSAPSQTRVDRSPAPASLNSSISSVSLAPDVVTFTSSVPVLDPTSLVKPVSQTGNAPDLSPNANEITPNDGENPGTEEGFVGGSGEDTSGDGDAPDGAAPTRVNQGAAEGSADERPSNEGELTRQEVEVVEELRSRDAEVRAHERAHQAVGGQYAGSISYSYQTGPDGKRYAIGGEVPIDVSAISGDPQATIDKMRQVKAAALAPAEPSAQDRNVASTAGRILIDAQLELAEQRRVELAEAREEATTSSEQRSQAIELYESFIGLGAIEVDPKDLIDELI